MNPTTHAFAEALAHSAAGDHMTSVQLRAVANAVHAEIERYVVSTPAGLAWARNLVVIGEAVSSGQPVPVERLEAVVT